MNAVLAKLAEGIKAATPAEVGNAKDAATGKTWYADIADTLTSGQASADAPDKLAHLQALQSLKTKVAAAVEAAKTAGKGDDTTGTSDKGGGQGTRRPLQATQVRTKAMRAASLVLAVISQQSQPQRRQRARMIRLIVMVNIHPVRGHYPRQQRQLSGQRLASWVSLWSV